jgi:hypothetical protein
MESNKYIGVQDISIAHRDSDVLLVMPFSTMRFNPVATDLCERRGDTFQRDDVVADVFRGREPTVPSRSATNADLFHILALCDLVSAPSERVASNPL